MMGGEVSRLVATLSPPPLMLDCATAVTPLLGHLGLVDCRAVARYAFAGATNLSGAVPRPVATPLSAGEVSAIHGAGLSALLVANNIGWGDTTGPNAYHAGVKKALEAIARAQALGYPTGCLIVADLETWAVDPAFIIGFCVTVALAGYRPGLYGSQDAAWRTSWEQASGANAAAACPCWTARYVGAAWAGQAPPWAPDDDGGANTLAWQFTDHGRVDLSEIQPRLLGLIWEAPHPAARAPAPTVDVAAVLAQLRQIVADAQQAEAKLVGAS